ncbi:Rv1355c family protein [Rhodococcus chondri]|uniref:Rv1355c family protein n=1 Tax=Rhodococcus chondri TaxID=3065941 RepID=A0ABU7JPC2_9NOCA|nr:Rv1355c family protein [Rhodococcus sp. CC-R104]MEE2031876.1 Rv1355c family protein [Rhodococcus sp. CC-R104]
MIRGGSPQWQPTILEECKAEDVAELDRLRSDRTVTVADRLPDQQRALREVLPSPAADLLGEPARWVYFPWRHTLVHILGPRGFRRLRLDRNRNKLTAREQERLAGRKIGVVGLSVGSAVAQALALEGLCGELRLADLDSLELSNLNRISASVVDLGVNKAIVAARRLSELDPYLSMPVWPEGLGPDTIGTFIDGLDVVVDECDSLDVKVLLRLEAARRGVPVVMETSDRGLIDVERFDIDATPPFHGLLGDIDVAQLAGLTDREKIPFALRLLGPEGISTRMAASLLEVNRTLTTWPQLGSEVMLGGATVAAVVRRLLLGKPMPSGRARIDLDAILDGLLPPESTVPLSVETTVQRAPEDPIDAVLHAASRAPSGGNSQPWSITVESGELRIEAGSHFVRTGIDIRCRGTYLAIGAALQNARIAAAAHGMLGPFRVQERAGAVPPNDVVAAVRFGAGADPELADCYEAMLSRATTRHVGNGAPLPGSAPDAFHRAARLQEGRIRVITDVVRLDRIADVLAEADRIRYLEPALRREMLGELRWPSGGGSGTGIDVTSLGLDEAETVMLELALREDVLDQLGEWDLGHALGRPTADRVRASAAFVAVFAEGPRPSDYVRAGMVAENVWVAAQSLELAVQPMTPVFLYAEDGADLTALSAAQADSMDKLQAVLDDVVEKPSDCRLATLLRITRARPERPRSARRSDTLRTRP